MEPSFYFQHLYPLQDQVLQIIHGLNTDFYLTGGTAISRVYLQHRFSDDLDLFVNDDPQFSIWTERIIRDLGRESAWTCQVLNRDDRFVRLVVTNKAISLKVEFINDVPAHVGEIMVHDQFGRVDSKDNILANKITALIGRTEPKDFADIWGLCCKLGMPLSPALKDASSKAAGIFAPDLARVLDSVSEDDWRVIRWIEPPEPAAFVRQLKTLAARLILIE